MKIALLISDLINSGGGAKQLIYLAFELSKDNHKVTIFTPKYKESLCFPDLSRKLEIIQLDKLYFN